MTILDFNNKATILYSGVLNVALDEEKKIYKKTGIVAPLDESTKKKIMKGFFNIMINDLKSIKESLVPRYGKLVLCCDY